MSVCGHRIAGTPANARGKLLQEENFWTFFLSQTSHVNHVRLSKTKEKRQTKNVIVKNDVFLAGPLICGTTFTGQRGTK